MKGAVSLPITVMVAMIIAVLVIIVAVLTLSNVSGTAGQQATEGAYSACCASNQLGGHCEEGAEKPSFSCSVPTNIATSGNLPISELAARTSVPVEKRCCGR